MPLFIGGPLDGRLIDVETAKDSIEVAIEHPIGMGRRPQKITDIFYYKKETIECPTLSIEVFVPRNYNCSDTLAALVQGYHQNALSKEDY